MYSKKFITMILLVFLLSACATQRNEDLLSEQNSVRLFLAMQPETKVTRATLASDESGLFDLAKTECPAIGNGPVTRITHAGKDGTLVTYVNDTDILCTILNPKEGPLVEHRMKSEAPNASIAMMVNNQAVTWELVQQAIAQIPEGTDPQRVSEQAFFSTINAVLLEQEASRLVVSKEELEKSKTQLLQEQGLDAEAVNEEQFLATIESQAKLKKLLQERLLLDDLNISNEQAQAFYLENTNLFLRGELAVMRQIFINNAGRTTEERDERIQQIASAIPTTEFCQLVREYSEDTQRKEECGQYIVPRGILPPQLEQVAFATPGNQTSVVFTDTGAHFVQTLEVLPAQVVPFAQVREEVRATMANNGLQERLSLYLLLLRSSANVIVYDGEESQQ